MQSDIQRDSAHERGLSVLIAVTAAAIITRIYGIAEWDFVGDEYYTVTKAAERYKSFLNPAYYALVMGSFNLFGVAEWSARLPAAVLGILSVPVFYVTWRNVIGRNAALIGAIFIIFSSWHLWHSQWSRFYTGVFVFGSLSYYFYYQAIKQDSGTRLLIALLSNVVGILFHATSVLVPAGCALFSLVVLISERAKEGNFSQHIAGLHLAACGVAGLIAMPFALYLLGDWHGTGQNWGYGPAKLILQIVKYVHISIAAAGAMGLVVLFQKDLLKAVFFAICIGLPVLLLSIGSAFVAIRPDYMMYALPLIMALAGLLCDQARLALSKHRWGSQAIAIVIVASLLPDVVSHYSGRKSLDFREAIEFVESNYRHGDRILSLFNFNYYSDKRYALEKYPGYPYDNEVPWREKLKAYEGGDGRVWIILPVRRQPLAEGLEAWLMDNARLVWRRTEVRYDYSVMGYQIFVVGDYKEHPLSKPRSDDPFVYGARGGEQTRQFPGLESTVGIVSKRDLIKKKGLNGCTSAVKFP